MNSISLDEFVKRSQELVTAAALNDDFLEITLENGASAVLISKPEWTIFREAMKLLLNGNVQQSE